MSTRWQRIILHADMDAFFAAVEQLDHPELRGKPVIVGHAGRRGVVSTCSYEARPFGVHSAMPMVQARRLCPHGIVAPPRFERYQEISKKVMAVFHTFSPLVEPLSLDEAFLDMSGAEVLFGTPEAMGQQLKAQVKQATGGLTVSVGIAPNKYIAKVASDWQKPDGLTMIEPDRVREFLEPLPVSKLWGVGPKAATALARLGLTTLGQIAAHSKDALRNQLGALGEHVWALARGIDDRPVTPERDAKSIGHEDTLEQDIFGKDATMPWLLRGADRVAARLRQKGLQAHGVRVKLKTASFRIMTRQAKLPQPTSSAKPLYNAAVALLDEFVWDEPLRLVGIAAFGLTQKAAPLQGDLFQVKDPKEENLDRTIDSVRAKFGGMALRRGSDLDGQ